MVEEGIVLSHLVSSHWRNVGPEKIDVVKNLLPSPNIKES